MEKEEKNEAPSYMRANISLQKSTIKDFFSFYCVFPQFWQADNNSNKWTEKPQMTKKTQKF